MKLQLKHILPYLHFLEDVIIFQGDCYTNYDPKDPDRWEEIYSGSALDVPWSLLDYYIVKNDPSADDGGIFTNGTVEYKSSGNYAKTWLEIFVVEDKDKLKVDK